MQHLPPAVTVRVPAKVNLALSVGPLRGDGFHALATVYQAVGLFDRVTAEWRADGELGIEVDGPDTVPRDASNLAVRAAALLRTELGRSDLGAQLTVTKSIPVAGGMAGGSADAAAALVACNELWNGRLGSERLAQVAANLGSDVPFLLVGGTALGTGRGEAVIPLADAGCYDWVFVTSSEGLSTPQVYAAFDALVPDPADPAVPQQLTAALAAGDVHAVGAALGNDLMAPALRLRPELAAIVDLARAAGAVGVLVSGSGPTVAAMAPSSAAAADLANRLVGAYGEQRVHLATGPVAGASILAH